MYLNLNNTTLSTDTTCSRHPTDYTKLGNFVVHCRMVQFFSYDFKVKQWKFSVKNIRIVEYRHSLQYIIVYGHYRIKQMLFRQYSLNCSFSRFTEWFRLGHCLIFMVNLITRCASKFTNFTLSTDTTLSTDPTLFALNYNFFLNYRTLWSFCYNFMISQRKPSIGSN